METSAAECMLLFSRRVNHIFEKMNWDHFFKKWWSVCSITHLQQTSFPFQFLGSCACPAFSRIQLFVTPWTVAHKASLSMDSPGKNTGVGCHFLLQGIFWPRDGICISCAPSLAGRFFSTCATCYLKSTQGRGHATLWMQHVCSGKTFNNVLCILYSRWTNTGWTAVSVSGLVSCHTQGGILSRVTSDLNKVPTVCLAEGICYNWTTKLTSRDREFRT